LADAVTVIASSPKVFDQLWICLLETSDYIEQNAKVNRFDTGESWAILSPIEQRIRRKI
jgi:hypothetical protein